MAAISCSAPGKIILFGEHAVVYGRRAIAIPVNQVQARVAVFPLIKDQPGTIQIISTQVHLEAEFRTLPENHPIRRAIQLTLDHLGLVRPPAMQVRISSTIPVAGGMGSGAAVSVALVKGISTFIGKPLDREVISQIVYEVEKIHHGTPSGIDNTVIAYNTPVLFQKDTGIQPLQIGKSLTFVIAQTGIRASTAKLVEKVRAGWQEQPDQYENWFNQIDDLTGQAVLGLRVGDLEFIGKWMTENHCLLQKLGVSIPLLDQLVDAACANGAFGAKLSGAGGGGNMIALVNEDKAETLVKALINAGAVNTLITRLEERE